MRLDFQEVTSEPCFHVWPMMIPQVRTPLCLSHLDTTSSTDLGLRVAKIRQLMCIALLIGGGSGCGARSASRAACRRRWRCGGSRTAGPGTWSSSSSSDPPLASPSLSLSLSLSRWHWLWLWLWFCLLLWLWLWLWLYLYLYLCLCRRRESESSLWKAASWSRPDRQPQHSAGESRHCVLLCLARRARSPSSVPASLAHLGRHHDVVPIASQLA